MPADDPAVLRRINRAIKNTRSLPAALKLVEDMAASLIAPNEQTYVSLMLVCRKQRQVRAPPHPTSHPPSHTHSPRAPEGVVAPRTAEVAAAPRSHALQSCGSRTLVTALAPHRPKSLISTRTPLGRTPEDFSSSLAGLADGTASVSARSHTLRDGTHAAQAERALVVYEAMKAAAVPAGLLTFNLLLRCTAQARRRDDALRIKQDMDELGVRADAATYTTLIEAVVKAGSARGRQPPAKRLNTAFELFQEMKGAGIEPDASTYNVLIEACSLAQQVNTPSCRASVYWSPEVGRGIRPYGVVESTLFVAHRTRRPLASYTGVCRLRLEKK